MAFVAKVAKSGNYERGEAIGWRGSVVTCIFQGERWTLLQIL